MTKNNDHISKEIIDNRDGGLECENCQRKPKTLVQIMRGGYIQEILCSECYTDLYPKEQIFGGRKQ